MTSPIKPHIPNPNAQLAAMPEEIVAEFFSHLHEHKDFFALAHAAHRLLDISRRSSVLQTQLSHHGVLSYKTAEPDDLHRVLCASVKWPVGLYRTAQLSADEMSKAVAKPRVPAALPAPYKPAAYSPNAQWVATLERTPQRAVNLKLWDTTNISAGGRLLTDLNSSSQIFNLFIADTGRTVLVKDAQALKAIIQKDGITHVRELHRYEEGRRGSSRGTVSPANLSVGLSPSGRFAVVDSVSDGSWEFWDFRNPEDLRHTTEIRPSLATSATITFSKDEASFAAFDAKQGHRIDFRPPSANTPRTLFTWEQPTPFYSQLRARVAGPTTSDWITRLERLATKPRREVEHPKDDGFLHYDPRYSRDGRWAFGYVLPSNHDEKSTTYKIWDLTDPDDMGSELYVDNNWGQVQDLDISNDANTLVVRTFDKDMLFLRDKDSEGLSFQYAELPDNTEQRSRWLGGGRSLAVSPSGRLVLTHNDRTNEVTFWDLSHDTPVTALPLSVENMRTLAQVAFSDSEDKVFTSDGFKGVQIDLE